MSSIKITVTQSSSAPVTQMPRAAGWIGGIIAAPFTGGLSLVVSAACEGAYRGYRPKIVSEAIRIGAHDIERATEHIKDEIRSGSRFACEHVVVPVDGWGNVTLAVTAQVEEEP